MCWLPLNVQEPNPAFVFFIKKHFLKLILERGKEGESIYLLVHLGLT